MDVANVVTNSESQLLLCRLPFTTDGRYDSSLCFKFLHSLIHFLAVKAKEFCNLTSMACVLSFSMNIEPYQKAGR